MHIWCKSHIKPTVCFSPFYRDYQYQLSCNCKEVTVALTSLVTVSTEQKLKTLDENENSAISCVVFILVCCSFCFNRCLSLIKNFIHMIITICLQPSVGCCISSQYNHSLAQKHVVQLTVGNTTYISIIHCLQKCCHLLLQ